MAISSQPLSNAASPSPGRQAREFSRGTGVLAKTDRLDVRRLAQMGTALDLTGRHRHPRPSDTDLLPGRRQLVYECKAEKLDRHSAGEIEIARPLMP
jgi:transposase